MKTYDVSIYTDGSCKGNPGPGGIGIVMLYSNHKKEVSRFLGETTNNRAEFFAAIEALKLLKDPSKCNVMLYTDSQLLQGILTKNWKAKANLDLVSILKELVQACKSFTCKTVEAHHGILYNELANYLAQKAGVKPLNLED